MSTTTKILQRLFLILVLFQLNIFAASAPDDIDQELERVATGMGESSTEVDVNRITPINQVLHRPIPTTPKKPRTRQEAESFNRRPLPDLRACDPISGESSQRVPSRMEEGLLANFSPVSSVDCSPSRNSRSAESISAEEVEVTIITEKNIHFIAGYEGTLFGQEICDQIDFARATGNFDWSVQFVRIKEKLDSDETASPAGSSPGLKTPTNKSTPIKKSTPSKSSSLEEFATGIQTPDGLSSAQKTPTRASARSKTPLGTLSEEELQKLLKQEQEKELQKLLKQAQKEQAVRDSISLLDLVSSSEVRCSVGSRSSMPFNHFTLTRLFKASAKVAFSCGKVLGQEDRCVILKKSGIVVPWHGLHRVVMDDNRLMLQQSVTLDCIDDCCLQALALERSLEPSMVVHRPDVQGTDVVTSDLEFGLIHDVKDSERESKWYCYAPCLQKINGTGVNLIVLTGDKKTLKTISPSDIKTLFPCINNFLGASNLLARVREQAQLSSEASAAKEARNRVADTLRKIKDKIASCTFDENKVRDVVMCDFTHSLNRIQDESRLLIAELFARDCIRLQQFIARDSWQKPTELTLPPAPARSSSRSPSPQ